MNRLIFVMILVVCSLTLSAQYSGELILGGRVNYVGGGRIVTPDHRSKNTGFTVKVAPSLSYFIRNGIAVGVIVGYEYMTDYKGHQNTGEVIPFIRYDFGGGRIRPFIQGESGCGWGRSRMNKGGSDSKHFVWTSNLKPGIWIRITDRWAADATFCSLQYKYVKATDLDSEAHVEWDDWKFRWLDISFGFSVIFGR